MTGDLYRCTRKLSGHTVDYFIQSSEFETFTDADILAMQSQTGLSHSSSFNFIIQALNDIENVNNQYDRYTQVDVRIYLAKGVHHYIYCFNSEDAIITGRYNYLNA